FLRPAGCRGMATRGTPAPANFPTELSTGRHDAVQHDTCPRLQPLAAPVRAPRSVRLTGSITKPIPPVKAQLRDLVLQAIHTLRNDAALPAELAIPAFVIERARSREHGDFACNAAMLLARPARAN